MHILIAPNAFKNSLSAAAAAEAISKGLKASKLSCRCTLFPVGDGGDGTGALIMQHCAGKTETVKVRDPLGRIIKSGFGIIDEGKTAVIEMADASGLRLLRTDEYDPLRASSFGTGELMRAALDRGVNKIICCIGGSATVDGATGILQALGLRYLDKNGNHLEPLPDQLIRLDSLDLSGLDKRIMGCRIVVLCDVNNTLLGQEGAAPIFGPQKGADPAALQLLEKALSQWSDVVYRQTGNDIALLKHGGAAGGAAAGLAGLLNAELVNGIEYFLLLTDFERVLTQANLVITGEGSIDIQTLQGKGPYGVAKKAREKRIPVIGIAGNIPLIEEKALHQYFNVLLSINNTVTDLQSALAATAKNLERTATALGNLLALQM